MHAWSISTPAHVGVDSVDNFRLGTRTAGSTMKCTWRTTRRTIAGALQHNGEWLVLGRVIQPSVVLSHPQKERKPRLKSKRRKA